MPNNQTEKITQRQPTLELYKNEGETPLECLERFRSGNPEYTDAPLSYVGRLDPMAEGILLVVVDEENKQREKYLCLDKVYEVVVLLGIETDTGDVLGICHPHESRDPKNSVMHTLRMLYFSLPFVRKNKASLRVKHSKPSVDLNSYRDQIIKTLNSLVGTLTQPYPDYSSKTVNGKPLFQWAREGRLEEIEIPTKTSTIYSIELLDISEIKTADLVNQAIWRIGKVKGDFRQDKIKESWKTLLNGHEEKFPLISIRVACSSGTYMRTLAEEIGKMQGTVGFAWKIKRTKIDSV